MQISKLIVLPNRKSQLSEDQKSQLHKQGYRLVGNHSAVKICEWTKKMMRNGSGCYKYIFYGIRSHQCLQMTTSMFCASRCKFCWRGEKAPVAKEWYGPIDSPEHIIGHAIDEHLELLTGFKGEGYDKTNKRNIEESKEIRHVALSLTGEPIIYPLINEILKAFHKRKISTFLVTNAQYPEQIEKIDKATQLYLSIDAPNKELMKEIDKPLFKDFWERTLKSLDLLKTRTYRTCIRLTCIKDENMTDLDAYASLIKRGDPDFIELKSYVWVGASQRKYKVENMPFMADMKKFTNLLLEKLPEYEYIRQHIPSRAILLIKKSLNKETMINYPKFFDLIKQGKKFNAEDYSSENMEPNK
ncbi:4-demethylwyosine synthase TYW1 [Candidatus Pacearchaeota archaeon]|nr:4-demethylwyosine synthase TYW1 [Candidatus Pacearchaeota archaeon]|tara:strand:- start:1353 stop:2423 length:1071 start_codon:yes stop_codon:yes gene_type:complete